MLDDRRQLVESRFRTLLLKWLSSLSPGGWEGTSRQLGDVLAAVAERHGIYAYAPISAGKKVAVMSAFITANGFTLTHHRTKHARTLRFTRTG